MKKLVLIIILTATIHPEMGAQGLYHHPGMFFAPAPVADSYFNNRNNDNLLLPGNFDLGVDIGSAFSSYGSAGSGFTSYIAPHLSYQVSEKFRISAGVQISMLNFNPGNGIRSMENGTMVPAAGNNYLLHATGSYLLHPNLLLSGSVYKSINSVPQYRNDYFSSRNDYQGMSLALDYRLSKSFRIGAEFRYQNQPFGSFNPWGMQRQSLYYPWW
jgi:hypothetical protein